MLYACDFKWWRLRNGVPEFKGLKLTQDMRAVREFHDLHRVELFRESRNPVTDRAGVLASGSCDGGGNSGAQALNLAIQFGAEKIVLVGFDMHGEHWHGQHPKGMNNPSPTNFQKWRAWLDAAAPVIAAQGVEVVNASPVSALQAYRFVDLAEC